MSQMQTDPQAPHPSAETDVSAMKKTRPTRSRRKPKKYLIRRKITANVSEKATTALQTQPHKSKPEDGVVTSHHAQYNCFVKLESMSSLDMVGHLPFPLLPPTDDGVAKSQNQDMEPTSMEVNLSLPSVALADGNTSKTVGQTFESPSPSATLTAVTIKEEADAYVHEPKNTDGPKITSVRTIAQISEASTPATPSVPSCGEVGQHNDLPDKSERSSIRPFTKVMPMDKDISQNSDMQTSIVADKTNIDRWRNTHTREVFISLSIMQKRSRMCDFTICINSANFQHLPKIPGIKVHRNVFAAVSKKIRDCQDDRFVLGSHHTFSSLLNVVEFVYTGRVPNIETLDCREVQEMCKTAKALDIQYFTTYIKDKLPGFDRSKRGQGKACHYVPGKGTQNVASIQGAMKEIPKRNSQKNFLVNGGLTPDKIVGLDSRTGNMEHEPISFGNFDADAFVCCDISDSDSSEGEIENARIALGKRQWSKGNCAKIRKAKKIIQIRSGEILVKPNSRGVAPPVHFQESTSGLHVLATSQSASL